MATPLRVLLIEDSDDDAQLVKHELEKGGWKLTFSQVDTRQALIEALKQTTWDIVLADYFVPGFEAPESLRAFKETGQDIPFVVVSGKMGEEEIAEMIRCGASDYVNKAALGRLIPVIKRELRERATREARQQARERMQETFAGLEKMVAERTAALAESNRRLLIEVEEHRATEESLRRTKEELELAITGSHGVMWVITFDPNAPLQMPEKANISAAQKALIGFADDEFPDSFSAWRSRIHPDDQAHHIRMLNDIISGIRADSDIQYRIQHKDRSWRWLHIRGAITRDAQGQPVRWTRMIWDLTEEKRAEETARLSEQRIALAVSATNGVVWDAPLNPDEPLNSPFETVPSMRALIGFDESELPSSHQAWAERVHPDDREARNETIRRVLVGETVEYRAEYRMLHRDGNYRWLNVRGHVFRDDFGRPLRFTRILWDVTEQKEAEHTVAEAKRRLEMTVSGTNGDIWECLIPEGQALTEAATLSPFQKRIIGFSNDELPDSFAAWEERIHPDDKPRQQELVRNFLSGASEFYEAEYRVRHRDGHYIWVHIKGYLDRGGPGQPSRWMRLLWDVSDRERAEERLRLSEAAAHQQLAEIESIYRNAGVGLSVMDREGRWIRINKHLADLNGLPVEAHLGRRVREVLPDLADQAEETLEKVFSTGAAIHDVEFVGETPAQPGVVRTWREQFLPLKDESGRVVAVNLVCEEVTEQKRLEEQIRTANERFTIALKNSATWVFTHDQQLRYTWAYNRVADTSEQDVLGLTDAEIYPGRQGELLTEIKRAVLETGQPVYREVRLETAAGEERFYDFKLEPLQDADGTVTGIIGAATNITSLVKQAKAIEESEEQHRALVEFSPDAIVMHVHGIIGYANPAFAALIGRPADQLVGLQILDYVSPEYRDMITQRINTVMESSEPTPLIHAKLRREDGTDIDVESTATRVSIRGQQTALVVMRNITSRLEAERGLLDATHRLQAHLDNSPLAIIEFSGDFTVTRYEGEAERIFGWAPEEVLGKKISDIPWVYEEDLPRVQKISAEMLAGRSTRNMHANRNYRRDGKVIHCEWYNSALRDEDGNLLSIFSQVLEVTDRVHAESALLEREHFLRTIHEASLNGLYIFDLVHSRNTYINPAYTSITGYTLEDMNQMTGDEVMALFHPEDQSRIYEHVTEVSRLQDGEWRDIEYRFKTTDGRWIWCLSRDAVFSRDEHGGATEMIGTFIDVTERKAAEEAIRQARSQTDEVIASIQDAFYMLDREWRYVYANDRALQFLGKTREELVGHCVWDIFPQIVGSTSYNELQRAMREQTTVNWEQFSLVAQRWVDVHVFPTHTGGLTVYFADIDERKRAETALRHSEAILKEAGQMAQLGAWDIEITNKEDINDNPLHWSDQIFRIFGYEPGAVPVSNELFFQHVHPDDRQKVVAAVANAITTNGIYQIEHRIIRIDGIERTVLEHGEVLYDASDAPTRIVGAVQDITDRKRVEETLQRQREWLRVTLSSIGDAVIVSDTTGRILFMNPVASALCGWPEDEALGQQLDQIFKIVNEDTAEPVREVLKRVLQEGQTVGLANHTALLTRDGRQVAIEDSAAPIRDAAGDITGMVLVFHDVTEKRKAENKLRRLFDSGIVGTIYWTIDGRITDANEKFLHMIGYSREELVEGQISWSALTPPEHRGADESALRQLRETGVDIPYEKEYIHKDGHRVPIIIGAAMFDETRTEGVAFVLDNTEHKRAEAALQVQRKLLETIVNYLPSAVMMVRGEDMQILLANPAYAAIAPGKKIVGRTLQDVWPELPELEAIFRKVLETGETYSAVDKQYWIRRTPDGALEETYFTWELYRVRIPGEEGWSLLNTAWETTDRVRATQAVRETQERFRIALGAAPIALWQQDLDLKYVWMYNSGGLGYEPSQFTGKDDFEVLDNHEDADRLTRLKRTVIESREPMQEVVPLVAADGRQTYWENRYEPWLDELGNVVGITGTAYDVTERTEAEKRLRESQERFRIALKTSRVTVFTQDRDLRYTWVYNPTLGLREEDMLGKGDLEVFPEETARKLFKLKRSVLVTGQPLRQIVTVTAPDSSIKYFDLLIEPLRGAEGGVSGIICSTLDLTERIMQEQALEESESRYRTLFELSPDGVFIQVGGRVQFANKAFVTMMHADSAEQLVGASIWDLIHSDYHDLVRQRIELAGTGEKAPAAEEVWIGLDGTEIEVEVTAALFPWQGQACVQVVLHDITDRKKAAAALAESEERYRDLVELSPDGVLIEASDGTIVFANKGFARMVGAESPEQLTGLVRAQFVHPDYHELMRSRMSATLVEGTESLPLTQERFVRLDGSEVNVEVAHSRYSWHGRPAAQIIVRDITERLEAEQAVRQASQRLEAAVNHIPAAFIIYDTSHHIRYINDFGARFTGFPREQLIGRQSVDVFPPSVTEKFAPLMEAAVATGETQAAEIDVTMRTGPVTLLASYVPIKDSTGRVIQVIAVNYDISTRKQFEQAIQESEAKLQRSVRLAHLGNWEWDQETDMLFWSPELRRIFGLEETSGISSSLFLEFTHPDDRERVRTVFERAFITRKPIDIEFRIVRSDGQVRYLQSIGEVTSGDVGAPRIFGTVHDITPVREATRELAESRAKLARASELARMGHWERRFGDDRLTWSDQLYDIFGLPRGEHVTIERFFTFIHPADRAAVTAAVERTIQEDEPLDVEMRILRPDSQVRYLHLVGEVTRDQSGAPVTFFGSAQDITDRVQADQAIRESEERFRSMADNAPVLIWVSDLTSRRTYVNEPWVEYRGRTREEELGNGWTEGLHPEDVDFVLDVYLANFHTRKPFEIEYRLRRYDGEYRWILDRGRPRLLPDGTFLGFIGSAIDITERRRGEATLFESEQRLRMAVNNYPAVFVVYDSERRIEFINRHGLEASGLTEDQIVGKRDEELFPPEVCSARVAMLVEAQETGQSLSGEIHTDLPTGEHWYVATYVPLYDREGRLSQILGITYDVTERKQAELQLKNAHDELEQRVFERTGELIEANKLLVREVEERTLAEAQLRKATTQLEEERANLERKNIALREIFDQIETEKTQIKDGLAQNIEQTIMPTIQRLKVAPKAAVPKLVEMLETDFRGITSPFINTLKSKYGKLTPREVEICKHIKSGMATKEIAEILNLSPMTVQKHREIIRKKLGLVNVETNLQSYLQAL